MTPVGFEPTQLALVELESTPLDHSGKVSWKQGSHGQIAEGKFETEPKNKTSACPRKAIGD